MIHPPYPAIALPHGGLRLDPRKPPGLETPPPEHIPKRLLYPLRVRDGAYARPLATVGERVLRGQILAATDDGLYPPLHAGTSGVVAAIERGPVTALGGADDWRLRIEADGLDEALPPRAVEDWRRSSPQELCERIHQAGIVGLGGAGFPSARKLLLGLNGVEILIINGAECEPYIACDDALMRHDLERILLGAEILRLILKPRRCLLAVEDNKPEALVRLRQEKDTRLLDWLEIIQIPSIYPIGGEKQLLQFLTGREIEIGRIPADVGVICHNVGTVAAIAHSLSSGLPLTSRIVTLAGAGVKNPGNIIARVGAPIAELIEFRGGYENAMAKLILGGPMMGKELSSDDVGLEKTSHCILALAKNEWRAEEQPMPCIRCGQCVEVCPVGLLPQELHWGIRAEDFDKLPSLYLSACIECACCDYVCPSHIPLAKSFHSAKKMLGERQIEKDKADHARARFLAKEARWKREEEERALALRRKKERLEKIGGGAQAAKNP